MALKRGILELCWGTAPNEHAAAVAAYATRRVLEQV